MTTVKLFLFLLICYLSSESFAAKRRFCDWFPGLVISNEISIRTPHIAKLNKSPIQLSTPRLTLRTPQAKDMFSIFEIFKDPETVQYTWFVAVKEPWTLETVAAKYDSFAKNQLAGNRKDFVLETKTEPKEVVGRCAIYKREGGGPNSWEFGITLHKDHWGNKYAEETMKEIIRYTFESLKAEELWFETEPENPAMLKQYERLGIPKFRDAEKDEPRGPFKRKYHQFLLTRDEWLKLK